ncbi:unnamed protein product, partial [Brachionus calyciflorus]
MNENQAEQARKKIRHKKFGTTRLKRAKEIVERAKTSPNELIEGDINSDNKLIDFQNVDEQQTVENKSSDDRINSENGINGQNTNFDQGSVQGDDQDDNMVESDDSQIEEKNDPTQKEKIIKEIFAPDRP